MIIIVFGLTAAGKTFTGQLIGKHFEFYHQDADQWLPAEMCDYIHSKKLFTLEMLENYTNIIINNIEKLALDHQNIVISQGLYRNINRTRIFQHFNKTQEIKFIQVNALDEVIQQRLIDRGDWVGPSYAASMHEYFEPMPNAYVIDNSQAGEHLLVKQLMEIPAIAALQKNIMKRD